MLIHVNTLSGIYRVNPDQHWMFNKLIPRGAKTIVSYYDSWNTPHNFFSDFELLFRFLKNGHLLDQNHQWVYMHCIAS